jgi:antitoxin (DNA-binding transcriptional repressor) of toxin-antitoxin stability system
MKHVPIKEARENLEELIAAVQAGEEIVLTLEGEPVAELRAKRAGTGGINWQAIEDWKTEMGVDRLVGPIPDDFDDPLPEDFLITPER